MSLPSLIASPASAGAGASCTTDFGLVGRCSGLIQDEGFADIDTTLSVAPAHLTMRSRPAAAVWRRRARHCRSRRARRPGGPRGS